MIDYAHDKHYVSFWSIERIVAERNETRPDEIGFADFLINSWYFVYRPSRPASFRVGWLVEPTESATFAELIDDYLTSSARFCVL